MKLFCVNFILMCGQFKPLVSYFFFSQFIFIVLNDTRRLVRYCFASFVTRALIIAYRPTSVYLDEGIKDCERKDRKA